MTLADRTASPETTLRVHDLLESYADENGMVSAAVRDVAEELSIGRETVRRAITLLLHAGGVEVVRRGTGHLYPTTYRVLEWPKVGA